LIDRLKQKQKRRPEVGVFYCGVIVEKVHG